MHVSSTPTTPPHSSMFPSPITRVFPLYIIVINRLRCYFNEIIQIKKTERKERWLAALEQTFFNLFLLSHLLYFPQSNNIRKKMTISTFTRLLIKGRKWSYSFKIPAENDKGTFDFWSLRVGIGLSVRFRAALVPSTYAIVCYRPSVSLQEKCLTTDAV